MKSLGRLPTIVCPHCKNSQTANIKVATHRAVGLININPGDHYIICVWVKCKGLVIGQQLEDLLIKYDTKQPWNRM